MTPITRRPEPTAQLDPGALFHIAFYKFVELNDPDAVVARLRELTRHLLGSILVATEGINGVLAGTAAALDAFQQALLIDPCFDHRFAGIVFKRSACITKPFGRIKVHKKNEIVALGVNGVSPVNTSNHTGTNVSPQEWRRLIAEDDVVVLDNRNSFEYRLGKFKSAIDPQVANFRDFPQYIADHAPAWQAAGKRVAMYCTGGIRCEKTSACLHDLGIEVYQLDGGILNYFQSIPDAERDWEGECFVFDNRIALDTRLQETDTTPEQVYEDEPDGEWRLQRARRLDAAAD
ncbi:rhodanese-related sulfurtransferase [Undibacterium arcticum]|uniref:tRNA uridine(34) hydroxylase n=1 Tax=Undibacterium arcticum TaxID=1762892 RepID=A0ABV7EZA7_9BURK